MKVIDFWNIKYFETEPGEGFCFFVKSIIKKLVSTFWFNHFIKHDQQHHQTFHRNAW